MNKSQTAPCWERKARHVCLRTAWFRFYRNWRGERIYSEERKSAIAWCWEYRGWVMWALVLWQISQIIYNEGKSCAGLLASEGSVHGCWGACYGTADLGAIHRAEQTVQPMARNRRGRGRYTPYGPLKAAFQWLKISQGTQLLKSCCYLQLASN